MVYGHLIPKTSRVMTMVLTTALLLVILTTMTHSPLVAPDVLAASARSPHQRLSKVLMGMTVTLVSRKFRNVEHHTVACHQRQQLLRWPERNGMTRMFSVLSELSTHPER